MRAATAQPRAAALGLRLPPASLPDVSWLPWSVVERAHGWHVSRESAGAHRAAAAHHVSGRPVFKIERVEALA